MPSSRRQRYEGRCIPPKIEDCQPTSAIDSVEQSWPRQAARVIHIAPALPPFASEKTDRISVASHVDARMTIYPTRLKNRKRLFISCLHPSLRMSRLSYVGSYRFPSSICRTSGSTSRSLYRTSMVPATVTSLELSIFGAEAPGNAKHAVGMLTKW